MSAPAGWGPEGAALFSARTGTASARTASKWRYGRGILINCRARQSIVAPHRRSTDRWVSKDNVVSVGAVKATRLPL